MSERPSRTGLERIDAPAPTHATTGTPAESTQLAHFRQLAAAIREVFWLSDLREPRLLYISPAYETIWGRSCATLYADPRSFVDAVHPEDRQRVIEAAEGRLRGQVREVEYRILRPDGEMRHIFERGLPIYEGERVAATCGVAMDVTQLKLTEQALRVAEERYRWLAENSTDLLSLHSLEGIFNYASPACRTLLGYEAEELLGRSSYEFLHPQDVEPVSRVHREVLSTGQLRTVEYRVRHKEGHYRWFESTCRLIAQQASHPEEIIAVSRDISRRKQDAELLHERQAELAHVSRLAVMGEMAAGLAHELNQPLAAIINYAEALLTRKSRAGSALTVEDRADLDGLIAQAERAAAIVLRVRNFASKNEIHRAPHDVNALVEAALKLLEPDFQRLEASVSSRFGENLPSLVVDPVQIQQVLVNLLRNALDAMADLPGGGRLVFIDTRADATAVYVSVRDAGPGVSLEMRDRIFEPYYTTKRAGMGLGLAISRRIVEAHGGMLTLEPAERGAHLRIKLPRPEGSARVS